MKIQTKLKELIFRVKSLDIKMDTIDNMNKRVGKAELDF